MTSQENLNQKYSKEISAANNAAGWNIGMAAAQVAMGAATGNIGFINEAAHNAADAGAFYADGKALTKGPKLTKRYRRAAATILTLGGIMGLGGGAYQIATGEQENSSPAAIGLAFAGAAINLGVARKTHSARHDHDHNHEHSHSHSHNHFDAHSDNKLHAVTDAVTGFIYAGGLAFEGKVPGAASYAILLNGCISTASAAKTFQMINASSHEALSHEEHNH